MTRLHDSESFSSKDPVTGACVRQVTNHPSIHHHPFYYLPAYDNAMRYLFFVSHRTGRPEIFVELRAGGGHGNQEGCLLQLTEHENLAEWSVHPSHHGRFVYFTDHRGGWRVNVESFKTEQLIDFGRMASRVPGMVGAAMGTTSLSRDDRFWAVPVNLGQVTQLLVIDTVTGQYHSIHEAQEIGHPQFHPDDPTWLRYAGPYTHRIHVLRRDGSGHRLAYTRDVRAKQWIVHETWRPGTMEILTADWPHGVLSIDVMSGRVRQVCSFNAWHPMVDRSGSWMVTDTNFPDTGLKLFPIEPDLCEEGAIRTLCYPHATSRGNHWSVGHCPYDDGPIKVYAPQHTHPHPQFSPDGKHIVFTTDHSGHAQVCEVQMRLASSDQAGL